MSTVKVVHIVSHPASRVPTSLATLPRTGAAADSCECGRELGVQLATRDQSPHKPPPPSPDSGASPCGCSTAPRWLQHCSALGCRAAVRVVHRALSLPPSPHSESHRLFRPHPLTLPLWVATLQLAVQPVPHPQTMRTLVALLAAAFFNSASAQVTMNPQTVIVGEAAAATLATGTNHMCWFTGTTLVVTPIATTDCLVAGVASAFGSAATAVCGASGTIQDIDFDVAASRFLSVIECTGSGIGVGPAAAVEITVGSTASLVCPIRTDYMMCALGEWDALPTCANTSPSPTMAPTSSGEEPSEAPSSAPSHAPSQGPSLAPSQTPTAGPTSVPTASPSTSVPSAAPSAAPSSAPTKGVCTSIELPRSLPHRRIGAASIAPYLHRQYETLCSLCSHSLVDPAHCSSKHGSF